MISLPCRTSGARRYSNCDADTYAYSHCNSDSDGDGNTYLNADSYSEADSDSEAEPWSTDSPDAATAALVAVVEPARVTPTYRNYCKSQ